MRFEPRSVCSTLMVLSLSACSAAVDSTEPAPPEVLSQETSGGVTLAALQLSTSHRVEFRAYPEEGVVGVIETGNVDADSAVAKGEGDESFEQTYLRLAGNEAKAEVFELLTQVAADPTSAPSRAPIDSAALSRPDEHANPPRADGVGQTSQAICAEPPNNNWQFDDQWFRANLCPAKAQYCDTLRPTQTNSQRDLYSETSFENMSFCSNAFFTLYERHAVSCGLFSCTRADFQLEHGTLGPRSFVRYSYWGRMDAAGNYRVFTPWISSEQGNWTALSHWTHR